MILSYTDSKLTDVIDDIRHERAETAEYRRRLALYKRFLSITRLEQLTNEELIELDGMGFDPPEKPRFPNGVVNHLVFDDLVGSDAFKSTGRSALTNLALRNRHLQCCIYIASQNLKGIPKSIRANTSLFALFKYSAAVISDDIYEEVSGTMSREAFQELYEYATRDPHGFLCIDFSAPALDRFKRNFDTVLSIE